MSRNRFVATRLTPVQAMELWSRSDEASAFTRPDYLERLVDDIEWWGVDRSGEIVAAWPLVRAVDGGEIAPPPFCYYVGPIFARSLWDNKYHRSWYLFSQAFAVLVEAVVAAHPRFSFSLPLGVTDVRILEWWNFDHPAAAGFTTRPRYTARIDLFEFPDQESLRHSFARNRKRALDRWQATQPVVVHEVTTERVIELHDQALERSGGINDPSRHATLRRLVELVHSGAGSLIGYSSNGTQDVEAAVILLDGPNESNFVFCGAGADWRDKGFVAWANWQALLRARTLGKRWLDFNGVNSPRRAADNHYYGARAKLYFDCNFDAS